MPATSLLSIFDQRLVRKTTYYRKRSTKAKNFQLMKMQGRLAIKDDAIEKTASTILSPLESADASSPITTLDRRFESGRAFLNVGFLGKRPGAEIIDKDKLRAIRCFTERTKNGGKVRHRSEDESPRERKKKVVLMAGKDIAGSQLFQSFGESLSRVRKRDPEDRQMDSTERCGKGAVGTAAGGDVDSPSPDFD